ncbi:MAG: Asp-tRNA(Asn)/Glu-tRNA(Gln) amidotransferase subunit GatB [Planctomycetota bacterium]
MMSWESVIGLEVHVQLETKTKLFCGCRTSFGESPNSQTCPVCSGHPGVLPVLNRQAVDLALRFGLALGCEIPEVTKFDRKNYFYPDLPKGYQISQYDQPINGRGGLDITVDGQTRRIGITRAHLEEDAGKLIHVEHRPVSHVDLNRAGTPLLEIVSEPDLRTPDEALAYLKALRQIVLYLEVSDGNMEEGSLRCDANVSVRKQGQETLGTKTEIKNLNSFKHVHKAIEYEIARQIRELEGGGRIRQETRLWNDVTGETRVMRVKEGADDYRYFPEPDLPEIRITDERREAIRKQLPELPAQVRQRLIAEHGLSEYDVEVLTDERDLVLYFEDVVAGGASAKDAANWILNDIRRLLNEGDDRLTSLRIEAKALAELIALVQAGRVSTQAARKAFDRMAASGDDAESAVKALGLEQISDRGELEEKVRAVIASKPDIVEQYRGGKTKALDALMGLVMRETKGKANPGLVRQILGELLSE